MDRLESTYDSLRTILGGSVEPLESVRLVETYRRYWKPGSVRIVLLAESHVFTSDAERRINIPHVFSLPEYPRQYARFVYCLGYGERELTKSSKHPKRDGTPQFWKVFYSCANEVHSNDAFRPILSTTDYHTRLKNKIRLLKHLRDRGVWLVDASILALYRDAKKPPPKIMDAAIRTSWDGYIRSVIESSSPRHVIVIGKGVADRLDGRLQRVVGDAYTVIAQPNAYLSSDEHMENFRRYYQICSMP